MEKPYVATGFEKTMARDSKRIIIAQNNGKVEEVDAKHIVLNIGKGNKEEYIFDNFKRTNKKTFLHHKPLVKKGDTVKKGDVLADNSSTEDGEIALGNNIRIAFMP
jgi:DNA-directed RNA polymerase subunit beta